MVESIFLLTVKTGFPPSKHLKNLPCAVIMTCHSRNIQPSSSHQSKKQDTSVVLGRAVIREGLSRSSRRWNGGGKALSCSEVHVRAALFKLVIIKGKPSDKRTVIPIRPHCRGSWYIMINGLATQY